MEYMLTDDKENVDGDIHTYTQSVCFIISGNHNKDRYTLENKGC